MNIPDNFDEPCALDPDDAPGCFQAPTPPPGFSWWQGWWPTDGINSLDDLKGWVESCLGQMISEQNGPLAKFGLAVGVQALKNADRYLGLHGTGDHPHRPGDEQLQRVEDVEDALEAVIRYLRQQQQRHGPAAAPAGSLVQGAAPAPARKRRWDRATADAAIREFVAQNTHRLAPHREDARANQKAAVEAARAVIGRNEISRVLGMSLGTVSKSPAWRAVAVEFNLHRDGPTLNKSREIDLDKAIAEKAVDEDDTVIEEVCRREAAEFIRSNLRKAEAALLLDQLEGGFISPDEAMQYAKTMKDHKDDTRTAPKNRR